MRSMNASSASHPQSFKPSQTSLADNFHRISLPADAASVSYADNSHSALKLNIAHSLQSAVSYPVTTAGYFVHSPSYLTPTGSIETAALRELQAFADGGGTDHVSTQSPDTTDTAGCQSYSENSSIGRSVGSVANDDNNHGLKELQLSPSSSVCTTCGRGCGCQQQSEDTVYRRMSQDSVSSCNSGSVKVESRSVTFDTDCQPAAQSSSPSAFLSSSLQQQQQQSEIYDVEPDVDMFSTPLELSHTLRELSIAAREPPTGSTADLIEHTIQAVVDAHFNTCLYTADKVETGRREYELMISTKPLVSYSLYVIFQYLCFTQFNNNIIIMIAVLMHNSITTSLPLAS